MAKPVQIAARYDNALVCLSSTSELFVEERGVWTAIPGPDGETIKSIACRHTGSIVAVTQMGRVYEQYRVGQNVGDYSSAWRLLPQLP